MGFQIQEVDGRSGRLQEIPKHQGISIRKPVRTLFWALARDLLLRGASISRNNIELPRFSCL